MNYELFVTLSEAMQRKILAAMSVALSNASLTVQFNEASEDCEVLSYEDAYNAELERDYARKNEHREENARYFASLER